MYFDRFDICEAYYVYFTQWHGGQNSREYARLSRMLRYFTPRCGLNDENDLEENARAIYDKLVAKQEVK